MSCSTVFLSVLSIKLYAQSSVALKLDTGIYYRELTFGS